MPAFSDIEPGVIDLEKYPEYGVKQYSEYTEEEKAYSELRNNYSSLLHQVTWTIQDRIDHICSNVRKDNIDAKIEQLHHFEFMVANGNMLNDLKPYLDRKRDYLVRRKLAFKI